jgi:hypothetical protein
MLKLKNAGFPVFFSEGNNPSQNQSSYIVQSGRDCMAKPNLLR